MSPRKRMVLALVSSAAILVGYVGLALWADERNTRYLASINQPPFWARG